VASPRLLNVTLPDASPESVSLGERLMVVTTRLDTVVVEPVNTKLPESVLESVFCTKAGPADTVVFQYSSPAALTARTSPSEPNELFAVIFVITALATLMLSMKLVLLATSAWFAVSTPGLLPPAMGVTSPKLPMNSVLLVADQPNSPFASEAGVDADAERLIWIRFGDWATIIFLLEKDLSIVVCIYKN
jgi:hypothetical protein